MHNYMVHRKLQWKEMLMVLGTTEVSSSCHTGLSIHNIGREGGGGVNEKLTFANWEEGAHWALM